MVMPRPEATEVSGLSHCWPMKGVTGTISLPGQNADHWAQLRRPRMTAPCVAFTRYPDSSVPSCAYRPPRSASLERDLTPLQQPGCLADTGDPRRVDGRRAALAGVLAGEEHAAVWRRECGQVGRMLVGIRARRDVGVAAEQERVGLPSSSWRSAIGSGVPGPPMLADRVVQRGDRARLRASPRVRARARRSPCRRRRARRTRWRGRGSPATPAAASRRS